jgi:hypothetical protein
MPRTVARTSTLKGTHVEHPLVPLFFMEHPLVETLKGAHACAAALYLEQLPMRESSTA